MPVGDWDPIKTNTPGLVLDPTSGALINNNASEWSRYQAERQMLLEFQQMKQEIAQLRAKINRLEEIIEEKLT